MDVLALATRYGGFEGPVYSWSWIVPIAVFVLALLLGVRFTRRRKRRSTPSDRHAPDES